MKAKVLVVEVQSSTVPWTVRVVRKGDRYGLHNRLTHAEDEPLIEFYDARYKSEDFDPLYGHFVSRYYWRTLAEKDRTTGLCLEGGVAAWRIDAEALRDALGALGVWE